MAEPSREVEQTVIPWRQILPALLINFNCLPTGMGLAFTSVAAASMVSEGVLTEEQRYIFASIYLIAAAVACPLGAPLLDRFGRKPMSIVMSSVSVIGWVLIATTSAAVPLYLGRLLTGISLGFVGVTANVYVVEITTDRLRGILGVVCGVMVNFGILIDLLVGSLLPWRYLALLGAAVSTVLLLGTLTVPESPRWLLLRKRPHEAMTELLRLRGPHADIHDEYTEMKISAEASASVSVSTGTLLRPRYVKPFLLSNAVSVIFQIPGTVIVFSYLDVIVSRSGWNENVATPTMLLGVAQFAAAILSIYVVAVAGRRPIVLVSLLVIVFSCAILGCVYYFEHMLTNLTYKWISLVLLFVYFTTFAIGVRSVVYLIRSELLPTRIRSAATSWACSLSYTIGFAMTESYPYVLGVIHDYGVFWMFATLSFISLLFIYLFIPETKDKSLEEIEIAFQETEPMIGQ